MGHARTIDFIDIVDESDKHAGHKSAGGLGHFVLTIKAKELSNIPTIQAHKKIYQILNKLMQTDIHALGIKIKN